MSFVSGEPEVFSDLNELAPTTDAVDEIESIKVYCAKKHRYIVPSPDRCAMIETVIREEHIYDLVDHAKAELD